MSDDIEELRVLVEEWRGEVSEVKEKEWVADVYGQEYANGISTALESCADELEQTLEDMRADG